MFQTLFKICKKAVLKAKSWFSDGLTAVSICQTPSRCRTIRSPLWQMTSRYTSEGIYLFRQVGELRIKRLQQINGFTFRIISDNPNDTLYPITDLDLREMQDYEFEIYGRYLWDCSIKL
jgi:peptidase, S24 (lexA) family (fragment)